MANMFGKNWTKAASPLCIFIFLSATSASAEPCEFDGLCEIINGAVSTSINLTEYDLHGLNRISASFGSLLTTDQNLDLNFISVEKTSDQPSGNRLSFKELVVGLSEFFRSRIVEAPVENSPGSGTEGPALFNSEGGNSEEYAIYLDYFTKYQAAKEKLGAAKTRSAKQFFSDELLAIDAEWIALGFKYQIEGLLRDQAQSQLQDPQRILDQLSSLESTFDEAVISRAIATQLSSDAWSRVVVEFLDESSPTIVTTSGTIGVAKISFEITEFPTVGSSLLPQNILEYIANFFSSGSCPAQDEPCKQVEEWKQGASVTSRVVLIRHLRLWLNEGIQPDALSGIVSVSFASENYIEMPGPFLYMTSASELGL